MNSTRVYFCLFMLTLLTLGLVGCQKKDNDNVVAHFKGGVLTVEDLAAHRKSMQKMSQFRNKPELLTPQFVFQHALDMEMIITEGLEEELHHDPQIRNTLHQQMSNLFLKIMQDKLLTPVDRTAITEEEMLTFYNQHKEQYRKKAKYNVLAFSVAPGQGDEIIKKIEEGLDFREAARQYALKERERVTAGSTGGGRTLRRFQPSWRPIVEKLEENTPTGPVTLDGTDYLLLLEEKTEEYQYSYVDKKDFIRNDILYNAYQKQWQNIYAGLKEKYKVTINQERLDRFYKESENQSGVSQSSPPLNSTVAQGDKP